MRKVLLLSLLLFSLPLSKYENLYLEPVLPELTGKKLVPALEELKKSVRTPEEARPSIWPVVGLVTSDYGWRRMGRYLEFHAGIDIAVDIGTPVVATAPGKVIYAGYTRGYGYVVVIYHGYGYTTVYAHMSAIEVEKGDQVARGKVIGYVGNTGRTTGPHLHYEVLKYGIRQNPLIYLP
ncbi:MAG: M23 family metallopeptidase [Aquificae bacterium]|nr:M23 family metallopeptidase [Aquificota bacterium]